jgi:hypothetical protein
VGEEAEEATVVAQWPFNFSSNILPITTFSSNIRLRMNTTLYFSILVVVLP